jgi:D-alanyl-D-alanine carboxypeptidase
VRSTNRAMVRGAATGLLVGALAVAGLVVADRAGDDDTTATTIVTPTVIPTVVTPGDPGTLPLVTSPVVTSPAATVPVATVAPTLPGTPAPTALPATTIAATPTIPTDTGTPGAAPAVDAASYAVLDVTGGRWLAEAQADEQRAVGSLMKLLTAYVSMAAGEPDRDVTVPALQLDPQESAIGLYEGETLSRAILIRALLIVSANDAARTLAADIGGSQEGFVSMMNGAAATLGLGATSAVNPIGLDADGAHSSARDMAGLAAVLMQDETFRATVARTSASLHGQTFAATNDAFLTTYAGADGVKTGHTTNAGWCLAASATRDGRQLIVVVLGSSSEAGRVAAASALLDWGFAQT